MVWRWIFAVFRLVAILIVVIQFSDILNSTILGGLLFVAFLAVEVGADCWALVRNWHRTPIFIRLFWIAYDLPAASALILIGGGYLSGYSIDGAAGQFISAALEALSYVATAKAALTVLALIAGRALRLPIVYRVPALSRSVELSFGQAGVVESLRRRARSTLARAYFVLFVIVGLIAAGVWLIIFAGTIALTDGRATSASDQVLAVRDTYLSSLTAARTELEDNAGRYQATLFRLESQGYDVVFKEDGSIAVTGPKAESAAGFVSQDVSNIASLSATLHSKRDAITDLEASIAHLNTIISQDMPRSILEEPPVTTDVSLLVASGVTRFGVLFVVVYLVQILLGVFRYVMRLSTFYHARADALTLKSSESAADAKFLADLMPNDIDFGRAPVTPSEYVVDIVKSFISGRWNKLFPDDPKPDSSRSGDVKSDEPKPQPATAS